MSHRSQLCAFHHPCCTHTLATRVPSTEDPGTSARPPARWCLPWCTQSLPRKLQQTGCFLKWEEREKRGILCDAYLETYDVRQSKTLDNLTNC